MFLVIFSPCGMNSVNHWWAGGGTGGMGSFAYEWVTKVLDEGNDWQLVCKGLNVSSWWRKVQFEAIDSG